MESSRSAVDICYFAWVVPHALARTSQVSAPLAFLFYVEGVFIYY
jgi:hypothetical protein